MSKQALIDHDTGAVDAGEQIAARFEGYANEEELLGKAEVHEAPRPPERS